jgi:hypothetical protein
MIEKERSETDFHSNFLTSVRNDIIKVGITYVYREEQVEEIKKLLHYVRVQKCDDYYVIVNPKLKKYGKC